MLPEPKKVAKFLKRTLFTSADERREQDERERVVQVRVAKSRIRRHINNQKQMVSRLKGLAVVA